jgi:hypothetical protein
MKDVEIYLNEFSEIFPLDEFKDASILEKNQEIVINNKDNLLDKLKTISENQYKYSNDIVISDKQSQDLLDFIHIRHFIDGSLEFYNLLPFEVKIKEILLDNQPVKIEEFKVPGFNKDLYSPLTISTDLIGVFDNRIDIVSVFKGEERKTKVYPSMIKEVFNPLIKKTSLDLDFLEEKKTNDFFIKKGEWLIDSPLIINGDLSIQAGTKLIFSEDSYLIVQGSINFNGLENEEIEFLPKDKNWKGFYLISEKDNKSFIKNLKVRNTSATQVGILNLTGGFTIYNSDIVIENLYFQDSIAEDSINIVNSLVDINNLNIQRSISDGLDCDFCDGAIKNSYVSQIGGDAIDFSGSNMQIQGIKIHDVKDKAISVGEKSFIRVYDGEFTNIGVGIASKDSSEAYLSNSQIRDFELFAAMTYQKKMIFGSESNLYLINTDIFGENPFRSQKGTNLFVDTVKISESDLNVEQIYSQGVMKK